MKPCVNDDVEDVSAAMGIMVMQEGLLKTRRGSCIGYSREGLSALMGQAAQEYIERKGGRLVKGKAALSLQADSRGILCVKMADGSVIRGDSYVSAVSVGELGSLLPLEMGKAPYFASLGELQTAPIVNVHLWYDKPVMDQNFVAFVDSPLQWVFNKTGMLDQNGSGGQYITISLSGAFEYVNQPKETLRQTFVEAMSQAFPKAKSANVVRTLVVKQERLPFAACQGPRCFGRWHRHLSKTCSWPGIGRTRDGPRPWRGL